jgi:transcription antitermination factor NusB
LSRNGEPRTGIRRRGREIALRALFLYDAGEKLTGEEAFQLFCDHFAPPVTLPEKEADDETPAEEPPEDENVLECTWEEYDQVLPFVRDLFFGVVQHQKELDRVLTEASEHWRLDRMSRVDRNVMRLALFEMLYRDDIPPKVSINEAIDLGKHFGTDESGAFINGVLDRIHRSHGAGGEENA